MTAEARPSNYSHLGYIEALDRLAVADRENAELRGEVERLRESQFAVGQALVNEQLRSERAESQLVAAQAQLAEEIAWRNRLTDRLEAVRALAHASKQVGGFGRLNADDVLAALSAAPQPEPDDLLLRALPTHLAYISRTVTASYPKGMDAELVMRRRVGKVSVESGELADAIEGYTGENPRKGVYATREDVVKELIDCASASLCAVEHMTGDKGAALGMLAAQVAGNAQRLSESIPDGCMDELSPSDNWRAADAEQRRREDIAMATFVAPEPSASDEPARCELHALTEYGTTNCPVEGVRANIDDGECSACGATVGPAASGTPDGGQ